MQLGIHLSWVCGGSARAAAASKTAESKKDVVSMFSNPENFVQGVMDAGNDFSGGIESVLDKMLSGKGVNEMLGYVAGATKRFDRFYDSVSVGARCS